MTKRMTNEEFLTKLVLTRGTEFSTLSNYVKSNFRILVRHNICGNVWLVTPNNLLNGRGCPKCKNKIKSKDFFKKVKEFKNGQLDVIGEYKGLYKPIKMLCKKHNLYFYITPTAYTKSIYKCPKCRYEHISSIQAKSNTAFSNSLQKKHFGNIICLDKYVNTHTKLHFKCLKCNKVFFSEPNSVLRISGCPYCAESHGEQIIANFLKNKLIAFEQQKTFENCYYKRKLRYDFYIPSKKILIEYDGIQHFKPIDFFGGNSAFKKQKKLDYIKDKYAYNNSIDLIRIKYTPNDKLLNKKLVSIFCKK